MQLCHHHNFNWLSRGVSDFYDSKVQASKHQRGQVWLEDKGESRISHSTSLVVLSGPILVEYHRFYDSHESS